MGATGCYGALGGAGGVMGAAEVSQGSPTLLVHWGRGWSGDSQTLGSTNGQGRERNGEQIQRQGKSPQFN